MQVRWMICWLNPYEDDQDVTVIVFVQVIISENQKQAAVLLRNGARQPKSSEIKHPCRHVVSVGIGLASPSCCLTTSELACTEGTGGGGGR